MCTCVWKKELALSSGAILYYNLLLSNTFQGKFDVREESNFFQSVAEWIKGTDDSREVEDFSDAKCTVEK